MNAFQAGPFDKINQGFSLLHVSAFIPIETSCAMLQCLSTNLLSPYKLWRYVFNRENQVIFFQEALQVKDTKYFMVTCVSFQISCI